MLLTHRRHVSDFADLVTQRCERVEKSQPMTDHKASAVRNEDSILSRVALPDPFPRFRAVNVEDSQCGGCWQVTAVEAEWLVLPSRLMKQLFTLTALLPSPQA